MDDTTKALIGATPSLLVSIVSLVRNDVRALLKKIGKRRRRARREHLEWQSGKLHGDLLGCAAIRRLSTSSGSFDRPEAAR